MFAEWVKAFWVNSKTDFVWVWMCVHTFVHPQAHNTHKYIYFCFNASIHFLPESVFTPFEKNLYKRRRHTNGAKKCFQNASSVCLCLLIHFKWYTKGTKTQITHVWNTIAFSVKEENERQQNENKFVLNIHRHHRHR